MNAKLKKLPDQVIVIIGASSGIGLATAEEAARRNAKLVIAARSGRAIQELAQRINAEGGEAIAVECDVADHAQVEQVAAAAVERFGRIDTWVNVAGLGMYGRLDETEEQDARRLFDINFWGVVNGSLAALPHLKVAGGALINVGSEVSDAYPPLLGMYAASKHAVKGYTDALRVEIEQVDQSPISITLIQPTAVNTPFPQHARNFTAQEPKLPDPMIEPEQVATAILDAAENPTRDKTVGAMALVNTVVSKLIPSVADKLAAKQVDRQHYDEPPRHPAGALRESSEQVGLVGRLHGTGGRKSS